MLRRFCPIPAINLPTPGWNPPTNVIRKYPIVKIRILFTTLIYRENRSLKFKSPWTFEGRMILIWSNHSYCLQGTARKNEKDIIAGTRKGLTEVKNPSAKKAKSPWKLIKIKEIKRKQSRFGIEKVNPDHKIEKINLQN